MVALRKATNKANHKGPGSYRCVYCKLGCVYMKQLVAHEKVCPSRKRVEQEWQRQIDKANRRYGGDKE